MDGLRGAGGRPTAHVAVDVRRTARVVIVGSLLPEHAPSPNIRRGRCSATLSSITTGRCAHVNDDQSAASETLELSDS